MGTQSPSRAMRTTWSALRNGRGAGSQPRTSSHGREMLEFPSPLPPLLVSTIRYVCWNLDYAYTHAYIHISTCIQPYIYTHASIHLHTSIRICTYMHTHTNKPTPTPTPTPTHGVISSFFYILTWVVNGWRMEVRGLWIVTYGTYFGGGNMDIRPGILGVDINMDMGHILHCRRTWSWDIRHIQISYM